MTAGIIIFLVILLLPVTLTAVHYFRRTIELGRALDRANERRREITNFLSRFSTGLQEEDGVEGAMHAAARHVAEQTDAESVAIYEVAGNELRVIGVCGTYPLIHSSNQLLFSRHHHLFEALRREEIPIGRGFLGGLATTRQAGAGAGCRGGSAFHGVSGLCEFRQCDGDSAAARRDSGRGGLCRDEPVASRQSVLGGAV